MELPGSGRSHRWVAGVALAGGMLAASVLDLDATTPFLVLVALVVACALLVATSIRARSTDRDALPTAGRIEDVVRRIGLWTAIGWAVSVNMSGIRLGPTVTASDGLLVIALVLLLVSDQRRLRIPPYLSWSVGGLAVLGLVTMLLPPPLDLARLIDDAASLVALVRFLLALAGVPLLLLLVAVGRDDLRRVFTAWVAGLTLVATLGVLEALTGSGLPATVTGLRYPGRAASLTTHPNSLGLVCAFLTVAALARAATVEPSLRTVWRLLAVTGLVGAAASGSRAGTLSVLLGAALVEALRRDRTERVRAVTAAVGVAAAVGLVLVQPLDEILPEPVAELAVVQRLIGDDSDVAGSDESRLHRIAVTVDVAVERPLFGIGYQYARVSHNVPLQLVLASGLLGLFAFVVAVATPAVQLLRDGRWRDAGGGIGLAGAVGIVTWLVFGLSQNTVYERWVYVPMGLAVAVLATRGSGDEPARDRDA